MPTAIESSQSVATEIVNDEYLRDVLSKSAQTRADCLALIDSISTTTAKPSNSESPSSKEPPQVFVDRQQAVLSALSALRRENRSALVQVRSTKQQTTGARQEVDRLHLQLQNLYYEERHLRGQIAACESYDHQYQHLPLIPLENFLEQFPQYATSDVVRKTEDEEGETDREADMEVIEEQGGESEQAKVLMFARIEHERADREALERQRQTLLKQKQGLIADNKKRKEDLASLDGDLERFIDAAKPIVKIFEKQV